MIKCAHPRAKGGFLQSRARPSALFADLRRSGLSLVFLLLAFAIFGGRDFLHSMSDFPLWAVIALVALFGLNLLLVSFRLWRILDHFGMALPPGAALRASVAGQAGALFVMSLFGQVWDGK